jgi:hypothetical protein
MNLATAVEFQAEIARLHAEIERLRLTDAEREALTLVRRRIIEDYFAGRFPDSAQIAAVIEELLERTK